MLRVSAVVLAACASLLAVGCATLVPQKSTDFDSDAVQDAARTMQTFPAGSGTPEVEKVLGPVDARDCQYWQFSAAPTKDGALEKLKLAAAEIGANGIINVAFDPNRENHCWTSIVATGTAVKLKPGAVEITPVPVAAQPAVTAPSPLLAAPPVAMAAGSTVTVAGTDRPELLQWVQRLNIPHKVFVVPGPKGGTLDLLDEKTQIDRWAVQAPANAQAAASGAAVVVPVAGITTLGLTMHQGGYQISASWIYSAAGAWELSDEQLKKAD